MKNKQNMANRDASLRDAGKYQPCFSTERSNPTDCYSRIVKISHTLHNGQQFSAGRFLTTLNNGRISYTHPTGLSDGFKLLNL